MVVEPEFRFEKLDVWQRAIDFADLPYRETSSFPTEERYGLTSQMRRAAVSISSNIAEGSGRKPDDFHRFLDYAYSSALEIVSQGTLANRRQYIDLETITQIKRDAAQICRMITGLQKSLRRT